MKFIKLQLIIALFACSALKAQDKLILSKQTYVIGEFQILKSTHGTLFKGGDLVIGRTISKKTFVGIGAEYSYCHYHNDNGWDLFNVSMLPIFIDVRVKLKQNSKITPYYEISQGLTFANYRKEDQMHVWSPYHVSERGYYVYGGFGATFSLSKAIKYSLGIGFKGYHISTHQLDVNPHGTTLRTGLTVLL